MTAEAFPQRKALTVLSMRIASMLIVDVRRTDYEGGAIRGSINIPAQGFYWNRGILYELAYKSDMQWVVFTCGSCKDGSRGARCAAWFLEHVRNTAQDNDMQVMVLEGGIKGWASGGPEYIQFMDGFDEEYWRKELGEPSIKKPEMIQPRTVEEESGDGPEGEDSDVRVDGATGEAPKEKVWSYEAMLG